MSMAGLARKAEIDRSYLSLVEHGWTNPTLSMVLKLANALDLAPSMLVDHTLYRSLQR